MAFGGPQKPIRDTCFMKKKKKKTNTLHTLVLSIKFQVSPYLIYQSFHSRKFIPRLPEVFPGFPGPPFRADKD